MVRRVFVFLKSEFNTIRNGKVFVFFVCLALASFLWFLNALEKRYTDHLSVPVRYVNIPKNKDLTGKLPDKLEITVDALGYTILRHKLSLAFSPLLIDVNELSGNYLESRFMSKYSISTYGHKEEFAKQISNDIVIIAIRPDTISFNVSNITEKLVKVHPVVNLTFSREFILQKSPTATPDSILIRGPEELLDTLKYINTQPVELNGLSQNIEKDAALVFPVGLSSEMNEVSVRIPVEQCTEAKFDIPISVINQPDSLQIKTFPARVKVSCKVGISQYSKLTNSSFSVSIDYSQHKRVLSKLPVILGTIPETVLSVDYYPKEVDYIIERK